MNIGKRFVQKQNEIYKNPLSPARLVRGARIDELRLANKSALVERGKDPSVLIVAFTGGAQMLMMPVYEFFDLTNSLSYSRILLRDSLNKRYRNGIDRRRPDYPSFLNFLQKEINKLAPQKKIFIGTSAGGSAAIRVGHDLGADYVHAFGAKTGVNPNDLQNTKREPDLELGPILNESNLKTRYYLHYCLGHEADAWHAVKVATAPGVVTLGYPGTTHVVAVPLAKKGLLAKLLLIENQEHIVGLAREFYDNQVIVTGN